MADIILLISIVCIIAFGYYVMCCLDKFRENQGKLNRQAEYSTKDVLLYKGSCEINRLLEQNSLTYDIVESPSMPALCSYRIVLGVSECDLNNLLICVSAKRTNPYSKTVAKCNTRIYREIFEREDVDAVVFDMGQIKAILDEWKVII